MELGILVFQGLMWESHTGKGKLEKLEEKGGKEGRARPRLLSRFLFLMCSFPSPGLHQYMDTVGPLATPPEHRPP